jgi:two-component system response regulator PilR (NtrC family)
MEKRDFRVLIADDDESVRDVVADIITREGYKVDTATDGNQAMDRILHGRFDLIITDLKMPGASGLDVLKRALSLDPDTSVVIITAFATLQSALEAVHEGAYDYVTKPFRLEEMLVTVGNAFKRTQLIAQNRFLLEKLRGGSDNGDTISSLERLARLRELGVVDEEEFARLKEKIMNGSAETSETHSGNNRKKQ